MEQLKNNSSDELESLWASNKGLCVILAKKNRWMLKADVSLSIEDLVQSAFFGLVAAARSYDPIKGKSWASWAAWYISKEFRRLLGWYSNDDPPPAHLFTDSLDVPAIADDAQSDTRMNLLKDDSLPESDASIIADELSEAVHAAMLRVPVRNGSQVLRLKYIEGLTIPQIMDRTGLSNGQVQSALYKSLKWLRSDTQLRDAVSLWDDMPTYGTGVSTFRQSGSQTERAAMWLLEHRKGLTVSESIAYNVSQRLADIYST